MKCGADAVMACDGENDGCGFCSHHCIYVNCIIHHPEVNKRIGIPCPYQDNPDECLLLQGAPDCEYGEDGSLLWRCDHFLEWERNRKEAIAKAYDVDIKFVM